MKDLLIHMILSAFISMLWVPLLIKFLYKNNIVRQNQTDFASVIEDRYKKQGTPIMGGLVIIITTAALTLLLNWNKETYLLIAVLIVTAFFGGLDDVLNIFGRKRIVRPVHKQITLAKVHKKILYRIWYWVKLPWVIYKNIWFALGSYPGAGLQAGEKILIQILSGLIVAWQIYFVFGWQTIWIPFLGGINLYFLMPVFIIFAIVAMANAVNISDGMDGLSSGLLIFSYLAFMYIAFEVGAYSIALLCAATVGSLTTYLYFNIKPARIEMGDVGSLALGAMLAAIAIYLDRAILLLVIGLPFVVEVASSLVQGVYRRIFGKRLFKMAPLHLHFHILGWSEEKTVMRFWLAGAVCAVIGLILNYY